MIYKSEIMSFPELDIRIDALGDSFVRYNVNSGDLDYYFKKNKIDFFEISVMETDYTVQLESYDLSEFPVLDRNKLIDTKKVEKIFLLAQYKSHGYLSVRLIGDKPITLETILQEAGITSVKRNSSREIDQPDKTTDVNTVSSHFISAGWFSRFSDWLSRLLFGF